MNQAVDAILSAPDRVICQALRANISLEQCARNQAQARMDPFGQLAPCLRCRQTERSREKLRPRSSCTQKGMVAPTKAYREAKANGELVLTDPGRRGRKRISVMLLEIGERVQAEGWSKFQWGRAMPRLSRLRWDDLAEINRLAQGVAKAVERLLHSPRAGI